MPRAAASILGLPIHSMLVPFPIAGFIGALVTDIVYAETANIIWATFSAWLIAGGLFVGALAALAGLIDHFVDRSARRLKQGLAHLLTGLALLVVELLNAFVHSRDGWTSVVPEGLVLSALGAVLVVVSGCLGGSLVYRHGVGTRP